MNPDLDLLQPYPFEKLRALLADVTLPDKPAVSLSVGEPRHPAPAAVLDAMQDAARLVENYPSTTGSEELRLAIAHWLSRRCELSDPQKLADKHVIPVTGTREGLFAIAQCLIDRTASASTVLMPNPFYQIYEGAALMAGVQPDFYRIDEQADHNLESISDERFRQCQLIYICTPGNPTGAVNSQATLQWLIEKAHSHDFIIVSDECYSEIYRQHASAPCSLLQASAAMGNENHSRCLAFHSLSKRSNLPGLRSGFVAGDAALIERFIQYRTYHGCAMSGVVQAASTAAWSDEQHVVENRQAYDAKFAAVTDILSPVLNVSTPVAGFYLWPQLPVDDQAFTRRLLAEQHVRVVPGSYLARADAGEPNPGERRIRLALVAPLQDCISAAQGIVQCLAQDAA